MQHCKGHNSITKIKYSNIKDLLIHFCVFILLNTQFIYAIFKYPSLLYMYIFASKERLTSWWNGSKQKLPE